MKVLIQDTGLFSRQFWFILSTVSALLFFIFAMGYWHSSTYQGRIMDGVYIDSINVSGLTPNQALIKLEALEPIPEYTVELYHQDIRVSSTSSQLGLHRDVEKAVEHAFNHGRNGSNWQNWKQIINTTFSSYQIPLNYQYDSKKLHEQISQIANQINVLGEYPRANLTASKQILLTNGKVGQEVNVNKTAELLQKNIIPHSIQIEPVVETTGLILDDDQLSEAKTRAEKYVDKKLQLKIDKRKFDLSDSQIIASLAFPEGFDSNKLEAQLSPIKSEIDREPLNAEFEYDPETLEVSTFSPSRDGLEMPLVENIEALINKLEELAQTDQPVLQLSIIAERKSPQISLADTNLFGINELIGFGESSYTGSIPSRIHNVDNASKRINNVIVKPNEEFSFNKALGEVSRRTGYQPAYVISGGQTVLGDGGGVCQVSTTLFRALLDSGLNITRRLPHSYRVSYYELNQEPGFDATVYSGNVDLRFINDSPNHILLHFTTDSEKKYMTVEIFGTSDGRTTEIVDYETWGYRGPPAPVYFDDPTLEAGKIIQVDWAVSGINAKFTHIIKDKDGNIISEKEYSSRYIPWSAKYRRGVGS